MLDTASVVYYWARIAVVALVFLLSLLWAFRRQRDKAKRSDLLFGVLGVVAVLVAAVVANGHPIGLAILVVACIAGVVVGYLPANARLALGLLFALLAVFATIMLMFGQPKAEAAGMYALGLAFGLPLGQGVRTLRSRRSGATASTAPVPASEPPTGAADGV